MGEGGSGARRGEEIELETEVGVVMGVTIAEGEGGKMESVPEGRRRSVDRVDMAEGAGLSHVSDG